MKKVIIIGSKGQDGSYLMELLKAKGDDVLGLNKDVDAALVQEQIKRFNPHDIYYLAAFHHSSQEMVLDEAKLFEQSMQVNVHGFFNVLETLRLCQPKAKVFYAASSHIFGAVDSTIQTEATVVKPTSIYGITKAAGLSLAQYFRYKYGMAVSVGILYNHESPRRGDQFVSQKIVKTAIAISQGKANELVLGDMRAKVDWGWAPEYVEAMTQILELPYADDFIIASGNVRTIEEFVAIVFAALKLDWQKYVRVDGSLIKAPHQGQLCGCSAKLKAATGWQPRMGLEEIAAQMIESGLKNAS